VFLDGPLSKEEAVLRLTEAMLPQVKDIIGRKALFDRVAEVEKLNQVLESGFYIPHAKFPELHNFFAVLGVFPEGFTDPATGPDKTYHVQVDAVPDQALLDRLVAGSDCEGEWLAARSATVLRSGGRLVAGDDASAVGLFAPGRLPAQPVPAAGSATDRWLHAVILAVTAPWQAA